jgi:hypothetical protein
MRARRRERLRFVALAALLAALTIAVGAACVSGGVKPPPAWLERLAAADPAPAAPGPHWALPPAEIERLFREAVFDVREHEKAGGGVMGALRVEAFFPEIGRTLTFKWKAAPPGGGGWNNTPRREIASYELQKWFLAPEDYVVPTTVARCLPLDQYRRIDPDANANLPGADCIFGTLSLWLEEVEVADPLLEPERFRRDAVYARHLAHYNLVTYLTRNQDTRAANVLVATDDANRRVFAVDNGITFGEWFHNFFTRHWNEIRVPALPRSAIEKLEDVGEDELQALAVVAEFRRDGRGRYLPVEPSASFDPEHGERLRDGALQIGLDDDEIEDLAERLHELLEKTELGEIPVF